MKRGVKIFGFVLLGAALIALFTWVTQLLWNWLVPELFGGPAISFWQTLGLLALSKILFSGLGRGGRHGGHRWGTHWRRKWASMTPEERERYREEIRQKYGDRWARWGDKWCRPSEPDRASGVVSN
jgi:hypothetical protein